MAYLSSSSPPTTHFPLWRDQADTDDSGTTGVTEEVMASVGPDEASAAGARLGAALSHETGTTVGGAHGRLFLEEPESCQTTS